MSLFSKEYTEVSSSFNVKVIFSDKTLYNNQTFQLEDMKQSIGMNPFANFSANGRNYYAHLPPRDTHELADFYNSHMPEFYSSLKHIAESKKKSKSKPLDPKDESIL